jgi:hypothetical protein
MIKKDAKMIMIFDGDSDGEPGTGEHLRTISKTQVFPRTSAKP